MKHRTLTKANCTDSNLQKSIAFWFTKLKIHYLDSGFKNQKAESIKLLRFFTVGIKVKNRGRVEDKEII